MSFNPAALDRWITGNWGEDRHIRYCPECGERRHHDEDGNLEPCECGYEDENGEGETR